MSGTAPGEGGGRAPPSSPAPRGGGALWAQSRRAGPESHLGCGRKSSSETGRGEVAAARGPAAPSWSGNGGEERGNWRPRLRARPTRRRPNAGRPSTAAARRRSAPRAPAGGVARAHSRTPARRAGLRGRGETLRRLRSARRPRRRRRGRSRRSRGAGAGSQRPEPAPPEAD